MGDELLLFVDRVDHGLGAGQQALKIQLRPRHIHTVAAVLAGVGHQPGGAPGQPGIWKLVEW